MQWLRLREEEGVRPGRESALARKARGIRYRRTTIAAREQLGSGVLIEAQAMHPDRAVELTLQALRAGVPRIYQGVLRADGVLVTVDMLERGPKGLTLCGFRTGTQLKPGHVEGLALKVWVAERCGFRPDRVELMYLRRMARPQLFRRVDVTVRCRRRSSSIGEDVGAQQLALVGELPAAELGKHCIRPYDCYFLNDCGKDAPRHPLTSFHGGGRLAKSLGELGYSSIEQITELPARVSSIQERQWKAVISASTVVDPGLHEALAPLEGATLAFVDFESVAPPVPGYLTTHPFERVPVQFSCHVLRGGKLEHHQALARSGEDPRPWLAKRLLEACGSVDHVLVYSAQAERQALQSIAKVSSRHADQLRALGNRCFDLWPVVRDNVYHPDFMGSFSLKAVVPALTGLDWKDLDVADGYTAALILEALLLAPQAFDEAEAEQTRRFMLGYCARDTLALVHLLASLRELSEPAAVQ